MGGSRPDPHATYIGTAGAIVLYIITSIPILIPIPIHHPWSFQTHLPHPPPLSTKYHPLPSTPLSHTGILASTLSIICDLSLLFSIISPCTLWSPFSLSLFFFFSTNSSTIWSVSAISASSYLHFTPWCHEYPRPCSFFHSAVEVDSWHNLYCSHWCFGIQFLCMVFFFSFSHTPCPHRYTPFLLTYLLTLPHLTSPLPLPLPCSYRSSRLLSEHSLLSIKEALQKHDLC